MELDAQGLWWHCGLQNIKLVNSVEFIDGMPTVRNSSIEFININIPYVPMELPMVHSSLPTGDDTDNTYEGLVHREELS